jgi:hypothetical protein
MTEQNVTIGLVSDREYTSTRVRGFAPWNPRQATMEIIGQVQEVLDEYRAQLPLTNRQIFYRLVGSRGYPKTEQAYARLCEYLNRARRASLISFSAIRDDGTQSDGFAGWDSPGQWWRSMRRYAEGYEHDLTEGQEFHIEVWVEAGGMVPQVAAVAQDYGIVTYSAGGFNGLTDKYETARRLSRQDRPCVILHCGDHDPSGLSIIDALAEDVVAMCHGLSKHDVRFERVLVTAEQIEQYGLPTAPQKGTDNRGEWMDETVQAEALPPDTLAAEVRRSIEELTDLAQLRDMRAQGNAERDDILGTFDQLGR